MLCPLTVRSPDAALCPGRSRPAVAPPSTSVLAVLVAAGLWAGLFAAQPACAQTDDRPNIVFILADDLGWSDLACYGNPIHDTPNIDRLARDGMRFTQAYSPAPICSASRAAVLTGKTPARLHFEFVTKSEPGRQKLDVPLQSPPFTLNLFPTFCEAAGAAEPPQTIDGRSLIARLQDSSSEPQRERALVWHFPYYHPEKRFDQSPQRIGVGDFATSQTRPHSAIRMGNWKLLQFHEDGRLELYDLSADTSEQNDLAASRPQVAARLQSQLANYLREVDARMPEPARR